MEVLLNGEVEGVSFLQVDRHAHHLADLFEGQKPPLLCWAAFQSDTAEPAAEKDGEALEGVSIWRRMDLE